MNANISNNINLAFAILTTKPTYNYVNTAIPTNPRPSSKKSSNP